MSNLFGKVSGIRPERSPHDLSHSMLFDCYSGQLIPTLLLECLPGDLFKIGMEGIVRMNPLVSPILHEISLTVHYFFVPNRLLWEEPNGWETFITGGVDGNDASTPPRWNPGGVPAKGSLWDFFGLPLVNMGAGLNAPIILPERAYYLVWNEYYRDETLQTKVDITALSGTGVIKNRDWKKDYFASALPWQQRGTAPALPVSGMTSAVWPDTDFVVGSKTTLGVEGTVADVHMYANNAQGRTNVRDLFNHNTVNLAGATSVNISDLRLAVQTQKFLERNARAGYRYIEQLKEHFGTNPRDERLQRPEYIGGVKSPIIISEVLKTSQDGANPQGNLAGHGIAAVTDFVCKYHCKEHGYIIGIMSIMPKAGYNSQGIKRHFLKRTKFDYFFPEFGHLSEQAIEREEIFADGVLANDRAIWGYQGRYDEYRVIHNYVANNIRDTLSYWTLNRIFSAAPALNDAFLQCDGTATDQKRIFAVTNVPGYIVHIGNIVKALRPIPAVSNPGYMDHF